MSSGRSRGRGGSNNKARQAAQGRAAQQGPQGGAAPRQAGPPVPPPPTEGNTSLPLWGGAILVVLVLAFLAILFLPGVFAPKPQATPTPGPVPIGSATAVGPTSVVTPGSAATGRIAFVRSDSNGRRSLFVVNADGTNQQQVTDSIIVEGTIVWTADGKSVVMQAGVEGVSRVVRVGVGGDNKMSDSAQLTADVTGDSAFPAISPDGTMIAYQFKPTDGQFQIYVMNMDGTNKRMVSDGQGVASLPTWSPDSKMVAYVEGPEQTAGSVKEIWTTEAERGTPRKLTNSGIALTYPSWSPDGKTIVSAQVVSEREYKLLIMDTNGNNMKTLDEGLIVRWPLFSPGGDAILYYTISAVGNDINIYDLASDRHSSPTKNQGDNYQPAWSPDGTMITWASYPVGGSEHKIVTSNRDGSNRRIVSSGNGDDSQPVWGPEIEK